MVLRWRARAPLLPYLVDVFGPTDEEKIKWSLDKTGESAVEKLLEILPRKGQRAFDVFVEALQNVKPHLSFHLGDRINLLNIHSKYFPDSDWLKTHA